MSSRVLARLVSLRFFSRGKILNEEKKAAENIYIKCRNPEEKPPRGLRDFDLGDYRELIKLGLILQCGWFATLLVGREHEKLSMMKRSKEKRSKNI